MKVVPMKTYQHLYERLLAYTMYSVWSMHSSILSTLHHVDQLFLQITTHSHPHSGLSFSSDQEQDISLVHMDTSFSSADSAPEPSDDEEPYENEDFQTVSMDDEHWTKEMVPERTFCIHKNGLPNNVCAYPCLYGANNTVSYIDNLDLSVVSDIEDHFLTTSYEEELPGLEEVPY